MLILIALLVIAAAGFAVGRMRPKVDVLMAVLAVFAALMAQSGLDMAFIEGGLDLILGDPRHTAPEAVVIPIAAGEAAGFWLAVVLVPWARFTARLWGGVYVLAAEVIAAIYHYFPFDLVVIPSVFLTQDTPPYLFAPFLCLPVAAVPFLSGLMKARAVDDSDFEVTLPE